MKKEARKLAVSGKGGVGKTSISALIVRLLMKHHPDARILAIDADPAIGLSTALNVDIGRTIDDIRKDVVHTASGGSKEDKIGLLNNLDYELFNAMVEENGFAFLAVGRPESDGCYCKINTYLKLIIKELAEQFDYVVIDGEAGIEQINRRVMETVTDLILISDASKKGIDVLKTIRDIAKDLVGYERVMTLINRLPEGHIEDMLVLSGLEPYYFLHQDDNLHMKDIAGESLLGLPDEKGVVKELEDALKALDLF